MPAVSTTTTTDVFDTAFFRAHTARKPIEITDHRGERRVYTFPTFFAHSRTTLVLTTARTDRASALLGDLGPLRPVRMGRGRCLAVLACFRYGELSDGMKGYHEMALGIAVSRSRLPILPALLRRRWGSFGFWLLDLPVSSDENRVRGVEIWGYPKTMKRFRDEDGPGGRTFEMTTPEGVPCMRLVVPRTGKVRRTSEINRSYSRKDGTILRTVTHSEGECREAKGGRIELEFGKVAPYDRFGELDLSTRPLVVRDFDDLSNVLYWPEPVR